MQLLRAERGTGAQEEGLSYYHQPLYASAPACPGLKTNKGQWLPQVGGPACCGQSLQPCPFLTGLLHPSSCCWPPPLLPLLLVCLSQSQPCGLTFWICSGLSLETLRICCASWRLRPERLEAAADWCPARPRASAAARLAVWTHRLVLSPQQPRAPLGLPSGQPPLPDGMGEDLQGLRWLEGISSPGVVSLGGVGSEVRTDLPHWRAESGHQSCSPVSSLDHEMTLSLLSPLLPHQTHSKMGRLRLLRGVE